MVAVALLLPLVRVLPFSRWLVVLAPVFKEIVPSFIILPKNSTPTPPVPDVNAGIENVLPDITVKVPDALL